jgi:FkbM family methyltransferase
MNRLRFYYHHSLAAYFIRRAKEKWLLKYSPAQLELSGVTLQLDCLPEGMRNVLLAGYYEAAEMTILPSLISADDQVLEIGSAIGFLGLYCQKVLKIKTFVGVEPNPVTLGYLRKNYALNGITPRVIEAAIAGSDGSISFKTSEMFWVDSLLERPDSSAPKAITVEGLTFASILKRAGAGFNALIIDVEGGEQYIPFDSLPATINKVLVEIHPQILGSRKAYGILEALICSGFRIKNHQHDSWGLIRD